MNIAEKDSKEEWIEAESDGVVGLGLVLEEVVLEEVLVELTGAFKEKLLIESWFVLVQVVVAKVLPGDPLQPSVEYTLTSPEEDVANVDVPFEDKMQVSAKKNWLDTRSEQALSVK